MIDDDTTDEQAEALAETQIEIVRNHISQLLEFFDTCQIFVSSQERIDGDKATTSLAMGGGNVYARQGQVREWLLEQDEYAKMKARGQCDCDCD